MRSGDPKSVNSILNKMVQTSGLGKQLAYAEIWTRWPEVAGPHLFEHGRPKTVKDGTLYIVAESPVWMHRFAFHKWTLIQRINHLTGKELVSETFILLQADEEALESQDNV